MIRSLFTGGGSWSPLIWSSAFFFLLLAALWFRKLGKETYKEGTDQTEPFLSGQEPPRVEQLHVASSNAYWGLTEALRNYLGPLEKLHSGVLNDYFGWLVVSLALGLVLFSLF